MAAFDREQLADFPNLYRVVSALLDVWPEHEAYCGARFRDDPPDFARRCDDLAGLALTLAGDRLDTFCRDYRWMCERFLDEEFYFRRHGKYRLDTFEQAYAEIYNNDSYMSRYVNGILISQIVWTPHARAIDAFRTKFLPAHEPGAKYLEVGPGHGLFLYFATAEPAIAALEAWDVSLSSIRATRRALSLLGVTRPITFVRQDILNAAPQSASFDSAVISEVLEHLNRPDVALQTLRQAVKPGGRIFINVPVNSPAPDHIYLWRTTNSVVDFVTAQGLEIETAEFMPITGASLERARRQELSISCVLVARRPV